MSKLSADGSSFIYSTYLGGRQEERRGALAVNSAGEAWIAGTTNSWEFSITAPSGCAWTATPSAEWLHVAGSSSGTGVSVLHVDVQTNPGATRCGTISIGSKVITIDQPGAGCEYLIEPNLWALGPDGGPVAIGITTEAGCPWTMEGLPYWLTVTSGYTGVGSSTLVFEADPFFGTQRSANMTIAGEWYQPRQYGSCAYGISATEVALPANGGARSVTVTPDPIGCEWHAGTSSDWLTIDGDTYGVGEGTVTVSASANDTGSLRTGNVVVGGQTVEVTQPPRMARGVGIFRDGWWALDANGNGAWDEGTDKSYGFGWEGVTPVPGDWNGDGIDEIGVFDGYHWYLDLNGNGVLGRHADRRRGPVRLARRHAVRGRLGRRRDRQHRLL